MIAASRQERQIVQSWLDLDDFLPGFNIPSERITELQHSELRELKEQGETRLPLSPLGSQRVAEAVPDRTRSRVQTANRKPQTRVRAVLPSEE